MSLMFLGLLRLQEQRVMLARLLLLLLLTPTADQAETPWAVPLEIRPHGGIVEEGAQQAPELLLGARQVHSRGQRERP